MPNFRFASTLLPGSLLTTTHQNADAVKDKIKILCSRITVLGELFEQPTNDEKEIKRREGLRTYANVLRSG